MGYMPPSDPDRLCPRQQATQAQQSFYPDISLDDDADSMCGSATPSPSQGDLYPPPLAPQKPDPERLRKALNEPDPFSPPPPPDSPPRPAPYRNRFVSSSAPPFEPLPTPFAAINPDNALRLAQSASHNALLQAMDFDLMHPRTPPNAPSEDGAMDLDLDLLHHNTGPPPTLPNPPQTSPPAAAAAATAAAAMAAYHHNRLTQLRGNSIRTAPPPTTTTRSTSSPQYQYHSHSRPQPRWTPTSNPDFTRPRTFGMPPNIDTTYSNTAREADDMNRMDVDPPRPQYPNNLNPNIHIHTNPNTNTNGVNPTTHGNASGPGTSAIHTLLARAAAMSLAASAAGYPRPWDSPPVSTFDFDSDTDEGGSNFGSETESEWESLMLDL
jgi:hypothetical protein